MGQYKDMEDNAQKPQTPDLDDGYLIRGVFFKCNLTHKDNIIKAMLSHTAVTNVGKRTHTHTLPRQKIQCHFD